MANIQMALAHLGLKVHVDAITRMIHHYSKIVGDYAMTIKAQCIPYAWGCGEKEQRISGKRRCIVAAMYIATRFMRAWHISDTKENRDAAPLLRAAKGRAGRTPRPFIADGPDQYRIASKKGSHTPKGLRSIHIRDIHIRNLICNTS